MRMKRVFGIVLVISGLLALACSDSGDATGPSGPTLSIADATAEEGNNVSLVVTLSQTLTDDVRFSYATTNGSAVAGSDYTSVSGMDTISAGMTRVTITVSTTDDGLVEATEMFTMIISAPINATIADGSATGSITDNDGMAGVSFASQVRPILLNRCATSGCHGTGSRSGGYTMGNALYDNIRSAIGTHGAIVVPGNSSASSLYTKTTSSPPFLARMPLDQSALSTADQNLIRDWIDEGANDN